MTPRELDAAIAKEIYRFLVIEIPGGEYSLGPPLYEEIFETGERRLHNPVPYYSSDPELAAQVLVYVVSLENELLWRRVFKQDAAGEIASLLGDPLLMASKALEWFKRLRI